MNVLRGSMRYLMNVFVSFIVILTAGCALSPEEQRCIDTTPRLSFARTECLDNVSKMEKQKEILARLQNQCDAFGFERDSKEYKYCLKNMKQQMIAEDAISEQQMRRKFHDAQNALSPNRGVVNCYTAPGSPVTTCQ